jgi:hypothetical protein
MEVHKRECREILNRFLANRISFPECVCQLDAALADLIPRMLPEEIAVLRPLMLDNNAVLMKEMERREAIHLESSAYV